MRAGKVCLIGLLTAIGVVAGCGDDDDNGGGFFVPQPGITSINGAARPTAAPGETIAISGSNFGPLPGTVRFIKPGGFSDTATVGSENWSDSFVLVTVPETIPVGSTSVSVVSANGFASSEVTLDVVSAPANVTPANVTWNIAGPLPTPLLAHAAVATREGTPRLYVIGGNTGAATVGSVLVTPLTPDNGVVGAWTETSPLPSPRAFPATALADPTNAPLPASTNVIYVAGGSANANDAPGGTSTVFIGRVEPTSGQVTWTQGTPLPDTRTGAAAIVRHGYLIVTGGLSPTGAAIGETVWAPVNADGSLGAFSRSDASNVLPVPVGLHQMFARGATLYVVGGTVNETTPYAGTATGARPNVFRATFLDGELGPWTQTGSMIRGRQGFVLFQGGDHVLVYEGAYVGTQLEGESATLGANGDLAPFTPILGNSSPNLNAFDTAGASGFSTAAGQPRFVILGGENIATPGTGTATVAVGGP